MKNAIQNLVVDMRFAIRQLRRSPAFTCTVVLTLALGIGLNAAIFTMVDCVLLRPLGYHDADRIYSLNTRLVNEGRSIVAVGGGDYTDLASKVSSLQNVTYYNSYQDGIQIDGRTLYSQIGHVSPQFGQVMGVEPVAGRLFLPDNSETVTDPQEVMVSSAFARQNFGGEARAVGQSVRYEGKLRSVVGVLPDGFSFPGKTEIWIEAPSSPDVLNRTAYNQRAVGKVKPGVSVTTLNAELATLSKQLSAAYPEDKLKGFEAIPLQEQIVGKIRPVLQLLMASVAVVLLIVCANITHLQLVRATRLRREVTIRAALGATRTALAKRAGLEVLLLAIAGCAAGVLVALPALRLLIVLAPREVPRLTDVRLNPDVIAYSFAVSLITMAITALLPLWRSWRIDPASALKQDASRGTESRGSGRLRQGLIVGEVALTLMLSVSAMLLVRQLIAESRQDLGFTSDHLVMLDTHMISAVSELPGTNSSEDEKNRRHAAQLENANALNSLLESIRTVPGVESVSAIYGAPMSEGGSNGSYAIHGVNEFKPPFTNMPHANFSGVTPGYFETMGIPVLKGRGITDADRAGSELVAVISESAAKQGFPGADPIGKQIMTGWDEIADWHTIVGVVGDVHQDSPGIAPYPTLYMPVAQHPRVAVDMQVMVRTRTDAAAMSATLERYMKQRFATVAVKSITMRESIGESERAQHFRTLLFSSFAGVSILLAMIGMYGVTAYTVAQKRFEFALRFALGAQRAQVLNSVLRRGLTVAAIGIACGVALSLALTRVASTLLGKTAGFDPVAYTVAAAAVLLIALSATLLPAYRAATVEPMQVLRDE